MIDSVFHSKKTKIIATLGPASNNKKALTDMFKAGVNVIRINASHRGELQGVRDDIALVRKTATDMGVPIAIFMDLQGPKIRVGKFENDKVELKVGQAFELTTDKVLGNDSRASVSYEAFAADVKAGEPLYIDDGRIRLEVLKMQGNSAHCKVVQGGILSNHKGVNLPKTKMTLSALTAKDLEDAAFAVEEKLDYIALSFVSVEEDVLALRKYIDHLGGYAIQIISKIERQQAIDNIISIIDVSDVIMVARGDLGVEIGVENVPKAQKMIIRESNARIKPVIVATQMLESMIQAKTATRAEVSDVANAIYDRCDAVMLSGETAVGIDPANVVTTMANIAQATDEHMTFLKKQGHSHEDKHGFIQHSTAVSFCKAADQVAIENNAKAIMAFTSSGNTPLIASKLNPILPVIAPTDEPFVWRRTAMYRGVIPLMLPKKFNDIHRWTDMITLALNEAKNNHLLEKGDVVVVTAGIPIGRSNGINSIRIVTV
ncbi:MAG: pyruvate kinase [Candidatus Margulisiibacteriota bacterium]